MKTKVTLALLVVSALMGCGTGDAGRSSETLSWVDEASLEGRGDLYIDPTVSWRPSITLADRPSAIRVEVEVFDNVAVAWNADSHTRVRRDIVGLFRVLDSATVTPIIDETYREGEEPVYTPGTDGIPQARVPLGADSVAPRARLVLIDFFELSNFPGREQLELFEELAESHPGCLEE